MSGFEPNIADVVDLASTKLIYSLAADKTKSIFKIKSTDEVVTQAVEDANDELDFEYSEEITGLKYLSFATLGVARAKVARSES